MVELLGFLGAMAVGFVARVVFTLYFRRSGLLMQEEVPVGKPFSEEEYAQNKAESQTWQLQQAIRKAGSLARRGKTPEAVKTLATLRDTVDDPRVKAVLNQEITRLEGNKEPPASPPPPPAKPQPPSSAPDPHDPWASPHG